MLKKTISLVMAIAMVFAMSVSASAAEATPELEDQSTDAVLTVIPRAVNSISGTIAPGGYTYYATYMYLDGTETMTVDATWNPPGNLIRVEFVPRSGGTTLGWTFDAGGSVSDFNLSLASLTAGDYYIRVMALSTNTGSTTVVFNFTII